MTYFDRLARRAHGERLTNAAVPRPAGWYDGGGFASEDAAALPLAPPAAPAAIAPLGSAARAPHAARSPAAEPVLAPALATPATATPGSASGPIPVAREPSARAAPGSEPGEALQARASDDGVPPASAPIFGEREQTREATGAPPSRQPMPVPAPAKSDAIRVHIGRVDVRAVFPPAPVQRPAPERPGPAMSLDQFLSRGRSRNGSEP
jgi:DNA polymerase-3 subunit gamma/tau